MVWKHKPTGELIHADELIQYVTYKNRQFDPGDFVVFVGQWGFGYCIKRDVFLIDHERIV